MAAFLPSTPVLLAFLSASLATLVLPGPSVVYVVARSLEQGRRAGLYSVLGLETGATVHVLAAAVGLAAVLASSEVAFTSLRWAGASYLVWLAAREFRVRRSVFSTEPTPSAATSRLRLYADGVLVDVLNPKTALFFLAFLPQFVDPARGVVAAQFGVLGLMFVAMAALVDSAYAVLAGRLSHRLRSTPRAHQRVRTATGGVYLALAGVAVIA